MLYAVCTFAIIVILYAISLRYELSRVERNIDSLLINGNFTALSTKCSLKLDALRHRLNFIANQGTAATFSVESIATNSTLQDILNQTLKELSERFIASGKLIITETENEPFMVSKGVATKMAAHILRNWRYSKLEATEMYDYYGIGQVLHAPFQWEQKGRSFRGLIWLAYSERQPPTESERNILAQIALHLSLNCSAATTIKDIIEKANLISTEKEAKDQFIKHLSHDMRSPIQNIKTILTILEESISENSKSLAAIAKANLERLNSLIENTLQFSKFQANILRAEKAEFALNQALNDVVNTFKISAEKCGRRLIIRSDRDNYKCHADEEQIKRIASNLIQNALCHAGGGDITITISSHDDDLMFSIKDTGCGISKDKLDLIFEPFINNGLGLTISKTLAELNNGKITVTSTLNQGTEFSVTLPSKAKFSYSSDYACNREKDSKTYLRAVASSR